MPEKQTNVRRISVFRKGSVITLIAPLNVFQSIVVEQMWIVKHT